MQLGSGDWRREGVGADEMAVRGGGRGADASQLPSDSHLIVDAADRHGARASMILGLCASVGLFHDALFGWTRDMSLARPDP